MYVCVSVVRILLTDTVLLYSEVSYINRSYINRLADAPLAAGGVVFEWVEKGDKLA